MSRNIKFALFYLSLAAVGCGAVLLKLSRDQAERRAAFDAESAAIAEEVGKVKQKLSDLAEQNHRNALAHAERMAQIAKHSYEASLDNAKRFPGRTSSDAMKQAHADLITARAKVEEAARLHGVTSQVERAAIMQQIEITRSRDVADALR